MRFKVSALKFTSKRGKCDVVGEQQQQHVTTGYCTYGQANFNYGATQLGEVANSEKRLFAIKTTVKMKPAKASNGGTNLAAGPSNRLKNIGTSVANLFGVRLSLSFQYFNSLF